MKRIFNLKDYNDDKIYYFNPNSNSSHMYPEIQFKNKYYMVFEYSRWNKYEFNENSSEPLSFDMEGRMTEFWNIIEQRCLQIELYEITEEEIDSILMLEELSK